MTVAELRRAVVARLHPDWGAILVRAWSVRLMLVGGACDAVALGVTFYTDAPEPARSALAAIGMVATFAGVVARLVPQSGLSDRSA